jgi:hypothetical protein
MGRGHVYLTRLAENRGQGTVEYVALILLIAGVLAAVVVAGKEMKGGGIEKSIVGKLKESIDTVGGK